MRKQQKYMKLNQDLEITGYGDSRNQYERREERQTVSEDALMTNNSVANVTINQLSISNNPRQDISSTNVRKLLAKSKSNEKYTLEREASAIANTSNFAAATPESTKLSPTKERLGAQDISKAVSTAASLVESAVDEHLKINTDRSAARLDVDEKVDVGQHLLTEYIPPASNYNTEVSELTFILPHSLTLKGSYNINTKLIISLDPTSSIVACRRLQMPLLVSSLANLSHIIFVLRLFTFPSKVSAITTLVLCSCSLLTACTKRPIYFSLQFNEHTPVI